MFDISGMFGTYEDRCVARFDGEGGRMISTAKVTDGNKPYETAFKHPEYNGGSMVIVEAYDNREEAEVGHARWLDVMENNLPDSLIDCCNSVVSGFGAAFGMECVFPRVKQG